MDTNELIGRLKGRALDNGWPKGELLWEAAKRLEELDKALRIISVGERDRVNETIPQGAK